MAVEIEAKMKVPDLEPVRTQLAAVGANLIGNFLERNTFFDTDDRLLLAADKGVRIRVNQNVVTGVRVSTMTFKGPRQHGQLKSREERETTVGNDTEAAAILESLKFTKVLSFEKKRESWSLGGCRIELDEIPHLGTYVEIEGPREETVMKVREELKLTDRAIVRASYIAMLVTHIQEQGEPAHDVTFAPPASK
jgi:adenylate cyclase class 2